jgi:uroporphyrinogen III methyltransferase/synthase
VSSASAVPAYAGIPITHREIASSFAVITGHKASERGEPKISWDKLATGADTLIILMGIRNLSKIVDELIKHGRSSSTPVAVITQGTTSRQRCLVGTLQDIVEKVEKENLQPPSVVVVGDVVQLRKNLRWFDK